MAKAKKAKKTATGGRKASKGKGKGRSSDS